MFEKSFPPSARPTPHPQHLLRDKICVEVSQDSPGDSSANALSAMLIKIRDHLHWGRFTEAAESLKDMLFSSMLAAAKEYRHMDHCRDLSAVQSRLRYGFKTYENRGQLKSRLDLLDKEIMSLRGYERVLTEIEKEKLAECYEAVAAHCLKGAILLEQHQQKLEQRQPWRKGENLPSTNQHGLILDSVGAKNQVTVLVDTDDVHCLMIGASGMSFLTTPHGGYFDDSQISAVT